MIERSMLEKLVDLIRGAERFALESDFDRKESIKRLSAATERPLIGYYRPAVLSLRPAIVVGDVSEGRVYLWVERIFVRNAFSPVFTGGFQCFDGRVILVGKFTMGDGAFLMLVFWGALMVFWTAAALSELAKNPSELVQWVMPAGGPLGFLLPVAVFRFFTWLSSADVPRMMLVLEAALKNRRIGHSV